MGVLGGGDPGTDLGFFTLRRHFEQGLEEKNPKGIQITNFKNVANDIGNPRR
jgi:hypothetical protein